MMIKSNMIKKEKKTFMQEVIRYFDSRMNKYFITSEMSYIPSTKLPSPGKEIWGGRRGAGGEVGERN